MYSIIIQHAVEKMVVPKKSLIRKWTKTALAKKIDSGEITIRIVGSEEMSVLNSTYRHKEGPTNVLSFPFALSEDIDLGMVMLGDMVICAEVVNREAEEQEKSQEAHWAHMVVHGVFHLLGYNHENENEANVMETLEIEVMQSLGFANPYETGEN